MKRSAGELADLYLAQSVLKDKEIAALKSMLSKVLTHAKLHDPEEWADTLHEISDALSPEKEEKPS